MSVSVSVSYHVRCFHLPADARIVNVNTAYEVNIITIHHLCITSYLIQVKLMLVTALDRLSANQPPIYKGQKILAPRVTVLDRFTLYCNARMHVAFRVVSSQLHSRNDWGWWVTLVHT